MQITKQEFLEKYGEVKVKFSSYYKYSFSFTSTHEGKVLCVSVGGNHDGIYRFEVGNDTEETVANLDPYSGTVFENGKELFTFYDY